MTIDDLYQLALARGLTRSRRHFSRNLLGRAPNYLADTRERGCSRATLIDLCRRFGEVGHPDLQAAALQHLLSTEVQP